MKHKGLPYELITFHIGAQNNNNNPDTGTNLDFPISFGLNSLNSLTNLTHPRATSPPGVVLPGTLDLRKSAENHLLQRKSTVIIDLTDLSSRSTPPHSPAILLISTRLSRTSRLNDLIELRSSDRYRSELKLIATKIPKPTLPPSA